MAKSATHVPTHVAARKQAAVEQRHQVVHVTLCIGACGLDGNASGSAGTQATAAVQRRVSHLQLASPRWRHLRSQRARQAARGMLRSCQIWGVTSTAQCKVVAPAAAIGERSTPWPRAPVVYAAAETQNATVAEVCKVDKMAGSRKALYIWPLITLPYYRSRRSAAAEALQISSRLRVGALTTCCSRHAAPVALRRAEAATTAAICCVPHQSADSRSLAVPTAARTTPVSPSVSCAHCVPTACGAGRRGCMDGSTPQQTSPLLLQLSNTASNEARRHWLLEKRLTAPLPDTAPCDGYEPPARTADARAEEVRGAWSAVSCLCRLPRLIAAAAAAGAACATSQACAPRSHSRPARRQPRGAE